jgi:hypothetical protein
VKYATDFWFTTLPMSWTDDLRAAACDGNRTREDPPVGDGVSVRSYSRHRGADDAPAAVAHNPAAAQPAALRR